jgi:hypothetical protein
MGYLGLGLNLLVFGRFLTPYSLLPIPYSPLPLIQVQFLHQPKSRE